MSIYSDKLAHVQVVINCRNTDAQMCTCEDALAYISGALSNVMSFNSLTTVLFNLSKLSITLSKLGEGGNED